VYFELDEVNEYLLCACGVQTGAPITVFVQLTSTQDLNIYRDGCKNLFYKVSLVYW